MEEKKSSLNWNKIVLTLFLFALSYVVLYVISLGRETISSSVSKLPVLNLLLPLPRFDSPMFLVMPVVGFFLIYFLIHWINDYFETEVASTYKFPIIFFFLSLVSYYIALFWYNSNIAQLAGLNKVEFDFWKQLRESAFYFFVLSGLFGWFSNFIVERILSK